MVRHSLRYVDWRITPDESPSTPPTTFTMECADCVTKYGETDPRSASVPSESFTVVQDWALKHSGMHRGHTAYRERIQRYWRTEMLGEAAPDPST
jgi:hypothetical protein